MNIITRSIIDIVCVMLIGFGIVVNSLWMVSLGLIGIIYVLVASILVRDKPPEKLPDMRETDRDIHLYLSNRISRAELNKRLARIYGSAGQGVV